MRQRPNRLVLTALLSLSATAAAAQATVTREGDGVIVQAIRLTAPLKVDGQLDEEVYRDRLPIDGFVQQEPTEGASTTEPTLVWVMFDEQNIYVAARCLDSQPGRMVANELRHDSGNMIGNEHIAVIFDTFHDRRNGYTFLVSVLGGMMEWAVADERTASSDWNTVWDAKTARFDAGWTVEMIIPFRSLRYRPGEGHEWGFNVSRPIRWKNEKTYLAPMPAAYGNAGIYRISRAATLQGLTTPPLAKNLEIKPYAIGGLTTDRTATPATVNRRDGDVGVDAKYGVTRSLTADLTINTDFAQVEEDNQQLNLTRFNLFFPEKRDFFLEGQGIFTFGGAAANDDTPLLFFSRQIGINRSRAVPIIAGGRITGKQGPYSLGALNIHTDGDAATGTLPTSFTVLRLRRDVFGRSTVGALFTDRSRSTRSAGERNDVIGADGLFTFFQNVRINTYVARSRTPGLTGNAWSYRGQFDYAPDRYGLAVERLMVGRDFNPEIGFMRRQDFSKTSGYLRFSPRPAAASTLARHVRKFYYEGRYNYYQTGTGRLESRDLTLSIRTEMQNTDFISAIYTRNYDVLEAPFPIAPTVRLPVGAYDWQQGQLSYQLGTRRRVSGTIAAIAGGYYGGQQRALSYNGRLALATRLAVEPGVSVNWFDFDQGTFTARLLSARVTSTMTPRLFVSVLAQYNSSTRALNTNARLRWEYRPGSELFVVYTEGRNTLTPGFPDADTRGFVVKINRLIRM